MTTLAAALCLAVCLATTAAANPIPCCSLRAEPQPAASKLVLVLSVWKTCLLARDAGVDPGLVQLLKDDHVVPGFTWVVTEEKSEFVLRGELPWSPAEGQHKYGVDGSGLAKACKPWVLLGPRDQGIAADLARDRSTVDTKPGATAESGGCSVSGRAAHPDVPWLLVLSLPGLLCGLALRGRRLEQ